MYCERINSQSLWRRYSIPSQKSIKVRTQIRPEWETNSLQIIIYFHHRIFFVKVKVPKEQMWRTTIT